MLRGSPFLGAAVGVALFAGVADAQIGNAWVTFSKQPSMLGVDTLALSDSSTQVAFGTGDLDQDGWDDVVAVRKEPASQLGKRTSVLLMNEVGVLVDRTAQYAAVSDTPGDLGFLTPRNTSKCALGDVNLDGWLDVVTANTLSPGTAKNISHPGVYVNQGQDGSGAWLGLRLENARTPQLITVGGLAVAPRFASVALGDLTGDGAPDAYFVDHDSTETGIVEPAQNDLNDRMLVNDGNGFFTDGSAAAFTTAQLESDFGVAVEAIDANVDGALDIVKCTTQFTPEVVRLLYNDPASLGDFTASGVSDVGGAIPYGMDVGNLNNDGILDVAIVDAQGTDRFRLGTGFDALNHVIFGPIKLVKFVSGSDDGYGRNAYLRDLDGNGWNDLLIADVDADLPGCNRRLHIYHNLGSVPGDMNLVLKEEAELASGGTGAGWKGVVGMSAADAKGSYDVAFGDFDRDGDLDFLLGTCNGAQVFRNDPIAGPCAQDLGFGDPGVVLTLCGADLTQAGSHGVLELTGAAPLSPLFLVGSLSSAPTPFKGGTLVPIPPIFFLQGQLTDGAGGFTLIVPGGGGPPVHAFVQCVVLDAGQYQFSNALDALIGT